MTTTLLSPWPACILPTCRSRGDHRDQEPSSLLCWNCAERLRARVRDIDGYVRVLDGRPRARGHTGPRPRGYSSRPPADLRQLALTDPRTRDDEDQDRVPAVLVTIRDWARAVTQACEDARHRSTSTLGDCLILLLIHTSWITSQACVDRYAADLDFVYGELRRAAGDGPPPPVTICACGGPIWLAERTHTRPDGGQERVGMARCTGCGTAYTALDLVKLHTLGAQT